MARVDRLFFDSQCGLCHRAVRFVANRDRSPGVFRFAPLQGETFRRLVPEDLQADLPDTMVVLTADGRILIRAAAVIFILERLGRCWRLAAALLRVLPPALRDRIYDRVARDRGRLFDRPLDACPLPAEEAAQRFDP